MKTSAINLVLEMREVGLSVAQIARRVPLSKSEIKGCLINAGKYQAVRSSCLEDYHDEIVRMRFEDGLSYADISSGLFSLRKLEVSPEAVAAYIRKR